MNPRPKSGLEYFLWAIFEVGIVGKALNGIWETIAGSSLLILGQTKINNFFLFLARGELFEHPRDMLISWGMHAFQSHGTRKFIGIYFFVHGITNLFLAVQLYRNRLWAYLVSIAVTLSFVVYQIYRIYLYHSQVLMLFTFYDIIFALLTWHEYKYQKSLKAGTLEPHA